MKLKALMVQKGSCKGCARGMIHSSIPVRQMGIYLYKLLRITADPHIRLSLAKASLGGCLGKGSAGHIHGYRQSRNFIQTHNPSCTFFVILHYTKIFSFVYTNSRSAKESAAAMTPSIS